MTESESKSSAGYSFRVARPEERRAWSFSPATPFAEAQGRATLRGLFAGRSGALFRDGFLDRPVAFLDLAAERPAAFGGFVMMVIRASL